MTSSKYCPGQSPGHEVLTLCRSAGGAAAADPVRHGPQLEEMVSVPSPRARGPAVRGAVLLG